jgi:hypothetical protein
MRRLLTFLWVISFCFLIEMAYSLPCPPEIDIVEISFNYESGYSYDALTIKKNNSTYVPIPEWKAGVRDENFAYIKSQTNRKIKAKFWMDRAGNYNVGVYAVKIGSGTGIGDVLETTVVFSGSQYSVPKIMTCNGTVPSSVGKRDFSWRWYVSYINQEEFIDPLLIGDSGTHDYYTLLAAPQSPMAEPWTEVLDYSCDWASGQSGSTGVAREVTEGIYYNLGDQDGDIDYDWPLGRCIYSKGAGNRTFELTNFLSAINSSSSVIVNCSDCGNIVNIFTAAVGISSQNKRIGNPNTFDTKSINPIGSPGWNTTSWVYHQYGWISSKVYDGCIEVNYGAPILPTDMTQGTYDSYLLAPGESYTWSDTGNASIE